MFRCGFDSMVCTGIKRVVNVIFGVMNTPR